MALNIQEKNLDKFIIAGDRVLTKPKSPMHKTASGLYTPLQAKEGDLAFFLQNACHEIELNKETYLNVSCSAILMLITDDGNFN